MLRASSRRAKRGKSSPPPAPPAETRPKPRRCCPELREWVWDGVGENKFEIRDCIGGEPGPLVASVTVGEAYAPETRCLIVSLMSRAPELWRALRDLNRVELWRCGDEEDLVRFAKTTTLLADTASRKPYDQPELSPDEDVCIRMNAEFDRAIKAGRKAVAHAK